MSTPERDSDPTDRPVVDERSNRLAGPYAIAFIASACVMIVELLAFRLVARHLGNSNYTVTAIIGVILGGLAIGNYVGGRLADRFRPKQTLALLFILSSASCFAMPILNKLVGEWPALWLFSWPSRIAIHVSLTFTLPAVLLGTIGPVVAKTALDRSWRVGRTVGSVYAFSAMGSILGTFACGFFLVPHFGNHAVILTVGALLGLMAITCEPRYRLPYVWALVTTVLLIIGAGPWSWARDVGGTWGLRERITPAVLFDSDSEYGHVRVEQSHDVPGLRRLVLDKLDHSYINLNEPEKLLYSYEKVYSAITDVVAGSRQGIRALVLGGGGYTHPRHILRRRPQSRIDVVEIDPVVTQAAVSAFGLEPDPRMKIIHLDARQYVADLVRRKKSGEPMPEFDLVFLDAVNDLSVPFHLTTREFQAQVHDLLGPDGVFLMTLIDVMEVGAFLGSTLRTMHLTYPHIECFYAGQKEESFRPDRRYTFVVAASKKDLRLDHAESAAAMSEVAEQRIARDDVRRLLDRAGGIVLTDNYAPVEFLLAGVVRQVDPEARRSEAALQYYNRGNSESAEGRFLDAVASYRRALALESSLHLAHLNLGLAHMELRQFDEAMAAFEAAARLRPDWPSPLLNLGGIHMLRHDYAAAVEAYERAITIDPSYAPSHNALGMALANLGRLDRARDAFQRALKLHSDYEDARRNLARVEAAMMKRPSSAPSRARP